MQIQTTKATRSEVLIKSKFDSFNYRSYNKPLLLLVHSKISLLLFLFTLFDLSYAVWAQQAVFGQDSFENGSNQTENRLDTIIELLEQSRQGSIIQLNLTIIVFMMGLRLLSLVCTLDRNTNFLSLRNDST